ncbi:hypothetical protein BHK69_11910 [Bosea vaviloviae]|uniref:Uncharacterized protein n=1 Tax=Bosea vaviloviae TaxID=1526658 RepID=A0A1D7U123_9HYPH|nr:hypothetical protein BHK69_11910 [Bosea vaviloviae]
MLPSFQVANRFLDIPGLRSFVAATEEQEEDVAAFRVVDAISRPMIDLQFADAVAQEASVAGVASLQPKQARRDPTPGFGITYTSKPPIECRQNLNLHSRYVA